jgi:hypothetical protein
MVAVVRSSSPSGPTVRPRPSCRISSPRTTPCRRGASLRRSLSRSRAAKRAWSGSSAPPHCFLLLVHTHASVIVSMIFSRRIIEPCSDNHTTALHAFLREQRNRKEKITCIINCTNSHRMERDRREKGKGNTRLKGRSYNLWDACALSSPVILHIAMHAHTHTHSQSYVIVKYIRPAIHIYISTIECAPNILP